MLGEHEVLRPRLDRVGIDNIAAAACVVEHLVEAGYRRIAALGVNDMANGQLRYEGYCKALAAAGLRPVGRLAVQVDNWSRHDGYVATGRLLDSRGHRPDAIFAFNDVLAMGALRAVGARGLRIPDDIAVAGIDNLDETVYTNPPITSLAPDLDAIADRSLDLLADQQRLSGTKRRRARQEFTPFTLVIRESTTRKPTTTSATAGQ
jgi:DNA-binding LacI/PurR family transcriptional regulator